MKDAKPSEYWLGKLSHSARRNVLRWHGKRRNKGMQLSEIDCFSIENIFSVMEDEHDIREFVGLGDAEYAETAKRIVEIRNRVAHPGLDLTATIEELNELLVAKRNLLEMLSQTV